MLVRRFLDKLSTSAPQQRAEIVRALVRVYLEAPLDEANRAAAETALIAVLDDPAPRVLRAMADALADSPGAPRAVICALAGDRPDIASIVLTRSPVLREADLVDLVGNGCERARAAIAARAHVGVGLSAAIAEVAGPKPCLVLLDNPGASIAASSLRRIVERHRGDCDIRGALLARDDLPVTLRQMLIEGLTDALGDLIVVRDWVSPERARRLVVDARERAVVDLATGCNAERLRPLVEMLVADGKITPGLLIRATCKGDTRFLEEALSVMTGTPLRRVARLLFDRSGAGLAALYRRAGLPAGGLAPIRAALSVLREQSPDGTAAGGARMGRAMIERVLTRMQEPDFDTGETAEFLSLLGRLSAEAAREDARLETGGYFRAA